MRCLRAYLCIMEHTVKLLPVAVFLLLTSTAHAAGVAVNETGNQPDASAMLDVQSTSKGFLPPRMTAAQRAAVSSPATGLTVYQTDGTAGLYSYDGSAWKLVNSGTVAVANGGTGTATAPTANGVIYAATSTSYAATSAGTAGQTLTSTGTGAPTWQSKAYGVFAVRTHSGADLNIAYNSTGAAAVIPFDTTISGNISLNTANGQITLNANTTYEIEIIIPYTNTTATAMTFGIYDNTGAAYVPSQSLVYQIHYANLTGPAVMKTIYRPTQTVAIDVRNRGGSAGGLNVTAAQLSTYLYGPYIIIKQL